jgi:molybdate transport system ATP-binding protein
MVLADRLVVIENGTVVQDNTPAEVARRPRTDYVARLVGLNLFRGVADGHTVRLDGGPVLTVTDSVRGAAFVAFAPAAVALHPQRPDGSPRNTWSAVVTDLEADRDRVRVTLDGPVPATAEVTPAAVADLELAPGVPIWATVKATDLTAYPR